MKAAMRHLTIQFRMDVRDRGTLLVFYLVPLGFYAVMGAVFSSMNPEITPVLSATMAIFSVSMGALIGLPPTLVKLREAGILRAYQVSGIPIGSVLFAVGFSAFAHLALVSIAISVSAPILFGAEPPESVGGFVAALAALLMSSVAVGLLIGATVSTQAMAMMVSQAVFMPTLMLSGIMFPANLLPPALEYLGKVLPGTHAMAAFNGLAYNLATPRDGLVAMAVVLGMGAIAMAIAVWRYGRIMRID